MVANNMHLDLRWIMMREAVGGILTPPLPSRPKL